MSHYRLSARASGALWCKIPVYFPYESPIPLYFKTRLPSYRNQCTLHRFEPSKSRLRIGDFPRPAALESDEYSPYPNNFPFATLL